jgi:hypothetical protein
MPELPAVYPTPRLDLTRYTEATRRELYARIVDIQFSPKFPAGVDWAPPLYTPDEAGLMVFFVFGRWFATWTNLEEPTYLPEHRRVELVRIQANSPDDIMLYEV